MFRRTVAAAPAHPAGAAARSGVAKRRMAVAVLGTVLTTMSLMALPASAQSPSATTSSAGIQAETQVLTWTAGDSITQYGSAPTEAVAGPATVVFENSMATGSTLGMPHTLTFDTSTPGYNHDVNLNILASPFDATGGRHEAQVTLTPGKYRYFCAIPGHQMVGELVVADGGGGQDVTAPTASAVVSGNKDANGNYIGSATVTVSAEDAQSGVNLVEYEVDDTGFRPYSAPVTVTAPGDHTVQYRATDVAGNMSAVGSVPFRVVEPTNEDTTAPTVSATVSGDKDAAGSYIGSAMVTVSAEDAQSGVDTVEYALDGAGFVRYSAPVVVNAVGTHMMHFRATDVAGNVSAEGMVSFTVVQPPAQDTTAPTVSAVVSGDKDANGRYIDSAMVTVSAEDAQSGVDSVEYALDGAGFVGYSAPVVVNAVGAHMMHFRATDVAGNVSVEGMVSFTVVEPPNPDTTAPTVSATVSGDKDAAGSYIGSATVTVSAEDAGSGVDIVEYALDGAGFVGYSAPVVVNAVGAHMMHFRATDVAGNVSVEGMVSFTVVQPPTPDTTAPTVSAVVSGNKDANGKYIDSATVTVTAQDAYSGVRTVEYGIDGGGWTAYAEPITIGTAGAHTVRYRATDVAGNVSAVASLSFTVVEAGSDACLDSDTRSTVIIGDDDTGVANVDIGNGCTINDLIEEDAVYANHGSFVTHVEKITEPLVAHGILSKQDGSRIVRAAARSDIGK